RDPASGFLPVPWDQCLTRSRTLGYPLFLRLTFALSFSVLMVRHRTVRKAPTGCPWPLAVLYRNEVFRPASSEPFGLSQRVVTSFVSPRGGNQEGADPNETGPA